MADHPDWCDPVHCSTDRARGRGLQPTHRATPMPVRSGQALATVATAQCDGQPAEVILASETPDGHASVALTPTAALDLSQRLTMAAFMAMRGLQLPAAVRAGVTADVPGPDGA